MTTKSYFFLFLSVISGGLPFAFSYTVVGCCFTTFLVLRLCTSHRVRSLCKRRGLRLPSTKVYCNDDWVAEGTPEPGWTQGTVIRRYQH